MNVPPPPPPAGDRRPPTPNLQWAATAIAGVIVLFVAGLAFVALVALYGWVT